MQQIPLSSADFDKSSNKGSVSHLSKYLQRHWPLGDISLSEARELLLRALGYSSEYQVRRGLAESTESMPLNAATVIVAARLQEFGLGGPEAKALARKLPLWKLSALGAKDQPPNHDAFQLERFMLWLDDDPEESGHSIFDPFVKDDAAIDAESAEGFIDAKFQSVEADTKEDERGPETKRANRRKARELSRWLELWNGDREFRAAAIERFAAEATRVKKKWEDFWKA